MTINSSFFDPLNNYTHKEDLVTVLIVFSATIIIGKIIKQLVAYRLKTTAKKTKTGFGNLLIKLLQGLNFLFFLALAIYLSTRFLEISDSFDKYIRTGTIVILIFYAIKSIQRLISFFIKQSFEKTEKYDESMVQITNTITSSILWVLGIAIVLQNFGYNVSAILGGLGVMGIAFGLAIKDILADSLSYFSIYFDKPFKVGDFITVGQDKGTVKKIGIKSTRLKTSKGDELIIPNQEITSSRINNTRSIKKRGVSLSLGITYDTPNTKLEKIPQIVEKAVKASDKTTFVRMKFSEFGESALLFEGFYYVETPDYDEYADILHNINLKIKQDFEKARIEFAYPTQSVFIKK